MSCWVCLNTTLSLSCQTHLMPLTSYCIYFYFENDSQCAFSQFEQMQSWRQLRKKTWGEGGSALLGRDTKLPWVSVISFSKKRATFNPKTPLIFQLKPSQDFVMVHCRYSCQYFFCEGVPAGALWWDEWSWNQSGSSGWSPLPVLHPTRGTSRPEWQNLPRRPDFGGNWEIVQ